MKPTYQCWTKAVKAEPGPPRYSAKWVAARRASFRVYQDRVECGDWRIPNSEIVSVTLFKSRQSFIPVSILSIQTGTTTYQFGFNPWVRVSKHLPFEFANERVRLRYSKFSIVVRVAVLAYLVFLFWQWLN